MGRSLKKGPFELSLDTAFEAVIDGVPERIVVVDEAYGEFAGKSFIPDLEDYENVIVTRTFSKAYGLAGLRIGYGVMPPLVADYLNRVRQPFNVNTLAQVAALAALDDEPFFHKTLEAVREGLAFLVKELSLMGVPALPTQANFFLIDVGTDARKVYEAMLRRGVIVRAMNAYGLNTYIRLTVGRPEENQRLIHHPVRGRQRRLRCARQSLAYLAR